MKKEIYVCTTTQSTAIYQHLKHTIMKHFLLFLSFSILVINTSFAQKAKVKIKKGTVSVNKVPYCKTDCKGVLVTDCVIKSLDGQILASLVFHDLKDGETDLSIFEVIFMDMNYKAQVRTELSFRKKLIRKFHQYKVIEGNALNEARVKNFVKAHAKDYLSLYSPETVKKQSNENIDDKKYPLVERDINKPLLLFGEKIQQNFKKIGTYKHETFLDNGDIKQKFSFYLTDGTLIATGIMAQFPKNGACKLTTIKDNKIRNIKVSGQFKDDFTKGIAQYLIERYYL